MRFKFSNTERQWRDIGFCLSLLTFGTEKSVKKLIEAFPLYQDKLYEKDLYKSINGILTKCAKGGGKSDMKTISDDFREIVDKARETAIENHKASEDALQNPIHLKLPEFDVNDINVDQEENEQDEDESDRDVALVSADQKPPKPEVKGNDSDATLSDNEEPEPIRPPIKKKPTKRTTRRKVIQDD
jgi:condensin complex subunit 1